MANTMGFVTPFKTFEDGYQSQNPLVLANDEYTKAGKTPVSWLSLIHISNALKHYGLI